MGIIPAAGHGLRMQSDTEKPYIAIGGRTILDHTLSVFESCTSVDGYVLVVEPSRVDSCRAQLTGPPGPLGPSGPSGPSGAYPKLAGVVAGGGTRQESVYRGLMALDDGTDAVLIHDAARPCRRRAGPHHELERRPLRRGHLGHPGHRYDEDHP